MDKDWINKDRTSHEYEVGLDSFMHFAKQNANNPDTMSCPCVYCGSAKKIRHSHVRAHLLQYGMDKTYHTFVWHGETPTNSRPKSQGAPKCQDDHYTSWESLDDMVHVVYKSEDDPNKFTKLLEDAEKPLYPGCSKFTKLSTTIKLYNLKAKYSWSDRSMTELLELLGDMKRKENS